MTIIGGVAVLAGLAAGAWAGVSRAGDAGHALLFNDTPLKLEPFAAMPSDALTFEAWVSTTDECSKGTLMSYAVPSTSSDSEDDFHRHNNAFVVYNHQQLLVCRDFRYLQLAPDEDCESCACKFDPDDPRYYRTASLVDSAGGWKHVAVTWDAKRNGTSQIFVDGLLMAEAQTGKTDPLPPNGAFILGAEQDCYGGCTERDQAFRGYMDEVRLWRRARTQAEILRDMRLKLGPDPDLVAYWSFDDPDETSGVFQETAVATDSSGNGHDLVLTARPVLTTGVQLATDFYTSTGSFDNNYAINSRVQGMPTRDITVEFWASLPKATSASASFPLFDTKDVVLSYASVVPSDGSDSGRGWMPDSYFADDAILIERYLDEYVGSDIDEEDDSISTVGSVRVHVNSNRESNPQKQDNWVDFYTQWTDATWHHIAVTWSYDKGTVSLYLDGKAMTPFWISRAGRLEYVNPKDGGVTPTLSAGKARLSEGSLVLGQNQECMGGCFQPRTALDGDLAQLRIWEGALSSSDIQSVMLCTWDDLSRDQQSSIAVAIEFTGDAQDGAKFLMDRSAHRNHMYMGSLSPLWHYSYAPLTATDGLPLPGPQPGSAGHALRLSSDNVLMVSEFGGFPDRALTLEFWMMSPDSCNQGTPFSYAVGDAYGVDDNTFDLFNYNDWGISVMEDEGTVTDHLAGFGSTDGQFHHIAVTWRSDTGETSLYDNGRLMWRVTRGKGKVIPSGGTLVVGREQDCRGGCFDSRTGARGSGKGEVEHGSQDFYGLMEEMRLWRRALTQDEILENMRADEAQAGSGDFDDPGVSPRSRDLVAYWKFDEGEGYRVRDETGHGHHLIMSGEPRWTVVPWLSFCGDGYVQGLEECDDGNDRDGDGCSSTCRIEPGWVCTGRELSYCTQGNDDNIDPDAGSDPLPWDGGGKGGNGGGSGRGGGGGRGGGRPSAKKHHPLRTAAWVLALVGAIGAAVYLAALAYRRRSALHSTYFSLLHNDGGAGPDGGARNGSADGHFAARWMQRVHLWTNGSSHPSGLDPLAHGDFVHASDLPPPVAPYATLPASGNGRPPLSRSVADATKGILQNMPGSHLFRSQGGPYPAPPSHDAQTGPSPRGPRPAPAPGAPLLPFTDPDM